MSLTAYIHATGGATVSVAENSAEATIDVTDGIAAQAVLFVDRESAKIIVLGLLRFYGQVLIHEPTPEPAPAEPPVDEVPF